jgi:hypothetical protein
MSNEISKHIGSELLVNVGEGKLVSKYAGGFSTAVVMALVRRYPDRVLTPREITLVLYHQRNRLAKLMESSVRNQLWRPATALQDEGELVYLIYDTDFHFKIKGMKTYHGDDLDEFAFPVYKDRARIKFEISDERFRTLERLETAFRAVGNGK